MKNGIHCFMAIRMAAIAGFFGCVLAVQAAEVFQENFDEGWSSNPEANQFPGLGVYPGKWQIRTGEMWSVVDVGGLQKKVLQFKGGQFRNSWWVAGTPHDVSYSPGKTLQLDGWIREATQEDSVDNAYLWLSTPEMNGYGLLVCRSGYRGGKQLLQNKNCTAILKRRDSTAQFGGRKTPEWKIGSEVPNALVPVETASDEYLHFFLRLKQSTNGAPVEISLYYNSTENPPVMTWMDDGAQLGGILNLESLTWVGVTADNGKETAPQPIQFDSIRVTLIQEH